MTNTFVEVEDPFSTGLDPVLIRQLPMISEQIEAGSRGLQAKGAGQSFIIIFKKTKNKNCDSAYYHRVWMDRKVRRLHYI